MSFRVVALASLTTLAYPASLTRVLLLDLLFYLLQLISLLVSFVTAHSGHISKSVLFPYDDLLLPPTESSTNSSLAEVDPESQKLRRRKGAGPAYEAVEAVDGEFWLDDDPSVQACA